MYQSLAVVSLTVALAMPAGAQDFPQRSTITVPISIALSELQSHANGHIPNPLVNKSEKKKCSGISCQVEQHAAPVGDLRITGSGNTLTASLPIEGSATVKGRGWIGRNIRETAQGAAVFNVAVTPVIRADWSIDLPLSVSIDWTRRPRAELFGVIPVTFGTEAEKALRKAVERFESQTLPPLLKEVDLRTRLSPLWMDLQKPHGIGLPSGDNLWLHVAPDAVGIAPMQISDGRLSTALSIGGNVWITDSATRPKSAAAPTQQPPNLSAVPTQGVSLAVPVSIGLETLQRELNLAMPVEHAFDTGLSAGVVTLNSVALRAQGERIELRFAALVTASNAPDFDGTLLLSGTPQWDAQTNQLKLVSPSLTAEDGGLAGFALNATSFFGIFEGALQRATSVSLSDQIDGLNAAIDAALRDDLPDGMQADVNLSFSAEALTLTGNEELAVTLRAAGTAAITGVALR